MDSQLEFSAHAFSKMVMHTMKYPHSVCCGLLLSPRPNEERETDGDHPKEHEDQGNNSENEQQTDTIRIIDAIPISHASHYLAPNIEVALNSVSIFAQEQDLVISGYYQTDRYNEPNCIDAFGQRVTEKIAESYPSAVLCFVSFDGSMARTFLDMHHLIDGKWRRRPAHSYKVEEDPEVIAECILYSKEKLYREIVDFDDHFDNISLDWTNAKISQRIDYLVANIC